MKTISLLDSTGHRPTDKIRARFTGPGSIRVAQTFQPIPTGRGGTFIVGIDKDASGREGRRLRIETVEIQRGGIESSEADGKGSGTAQS